MTSSKAPEPFPWQRVMSVGLGLLQLSPAHFWSMTIPEFEAAVSGLTGSEVLSTPLARSDLDELMLRFPD